MNNQGIVIVCMMLILGFLFSPIHSQEKLLTIGLRGGLNSSTVSEERGVPDFDFQEVTVDVELNRRTKFIGGGFLEYWLSRSLALQLNVLYQQKGVQIATEFDGLLFDPESGMTLTVFGETKQSLRLSYISLPLMAKLAFGAGNSSAARPYIIAGPEAGFLLSAKTSDLKGDLKGYVPGLGGGAVDIRESGSDVKDTVESMDFAINVGAGIIFPLRETKIFLDGWYSLGLSKINKEGSENVKNNVVTLNLGLMF